VRGNVDQRSSREAAACSRLQHLDLQHESPFQCLEGDKRSAIPNLFRYFCCGDFGASFDAIKRPRLAVPFNSNIACWHIAKFCYTAKSVAIGGKADMAGDLLSARSGPD
jgi:hypothetical protein